MARYGRERATGIVDGLVIDAGRVDGRLQRALQAEIVRGDQTPVDEVGERHERSAFPDFFHHRSSEGVDFAVGEFAVRRPGGGGTVVITEGAGEAGERGPRGHTRGVGNLLAAQGAEHGLPSRLGGRVHVEAAVVERVRWDERWVGKREGLAARGWCIGDAFVGERVAALVEGVLDARNLRQVGHAVGGEREGLIGLDLRVGRQVRSARPRRGVIAVGGDLRIQAAKEITIPEREVSREGVIGTDVRVMAHDVRATRFGDVAVLDDGFLAAALGAWPIADLGETLNARVGEGCTHGEVGFRAGLRGRGIAELGEREEWATRDREEHDVSIAALADEDALAPVATVAAGVIEVVQFVDAELIDGALAHDPIGGGVRLAIVRPHEGLRGARAKDIR